MAEVNIVSAVGKLEADTQKARSEGLTDLKRILDTWRLSGTIPDDAFHKIFELLYKIVAKEKPSYIRASSKPTTKNNAAGRLQVTAAALRLAVEVGTSHIRFKTALSILDHVVEALPCADGSYCEPLMNDYLKIFKTLLDRGRHGEHMRTKQWQKYTDFALSILSAGLEAQPQIDDYSISRDATNPSRNGYHLSVRLSQRSGKNTTKDNASHADEIVAALKSLTAITTAPVMSRRTELSETLTQHLVFATRGHENAFEALNNIIFVSLAEDVNFTRSLVAALIPVMRRLWSHKSIILREQLLVMLFSTRYLFLSQSDIWEAIEPDSLDLMLQGILSEYNSRNERDILLLDDLLLSLPGEPCPLRTKQFHPVRNSPRAVAAWTTVAIIASLVLGISGSSKQDISPEKTGGARKRRKLHNPLEEIIQTAVVGSGQTRLIALQICVLLTDQPLYLGSRLSENMERFLPGLSHEDSSIQSWTYLLFSRLALQSTSSLEHETNSWLVIWNSARQAISVPTTVRAACHTMATMIESSRIPLDLTATMIENTLFATGSNGPCSLTDTSLLLMINALRSRYFSRGRDFEAFSARITAWLSMRWTLPSTLDRIHNGSMAFHVRPELLYALLSSVCGYRDSIVPYVDCSPVQPIYRAAMTVTAEVEFLQYLLEIREDESWKSSHSKDINQFHLDSLQVSRLQRSVADLLAGRLKEFQLAFTTIRSERSSNIGSDIVDMMTVATFVWSSLCTRSPRVAAELAPSSLCASSWDALNDFVSNESDDMSISLANRISNTLLRFHAQLDATDIEWNCNEHHSFLESALKLCRCCMESIPTKADIDQMLLDDNGWTSQSTQSGISNADGSFFRQDLPVCRDDFGLMASNIIKLSSTLQTVKTKRMLVPAATSLVIDDILALEPGHLLAACGSVCAFLELKPGIKRSDAARFLKALAKTYLQDEAFERCEAALCFCLRALHSLASLWVSEEEEDAVVEVAFDVYNYTVGVALGKSPASAKTLSQLSRLLHLLLQLNPNYATEDLPSPRTSLLRLLHASTPANKFHFSRMLFQLFEKFVLTQHEAIFDDVVENLPADPDYKEGIAARLYVLAQLGSRWHTVLRQATYHLFETAANVPSTTSLARSCISLICSKLNLSSSKELFRLFAPQISYTWLSKDGLSRMPFQAFGYVTLEEMTLDNLKELTGQISLRGGGFADELVALTGENWPSLLGAAFPTAFAYTLSSETSLPKQDRLFDGSEKLLRKQLGSAMYLQLLQQRLPDIVSQLIICLQNDHAIERGFERSQQISALNAWEEMSTQSTTNMELPLSQQPSFRARALSEELNYICTRLDLQLNEIWSPALSIHVYRCLLSNAKPAMGPLHACGVIRKLRIAISLAGHVALSGYPLEMLLHNLRPYLTVFECAEDTMGIYRYLLQHGRPYLVSRISFIAGLGVSIFGSLTGFIRSSQDSTTQESHFLATISKAQEFRSFLGQFLESVPLVNLSDATIAMFRRIVQHAKSIAQPGNSARSTSEGCLLLALLEDRNSRNPLLTTVHFDVSLEILCRDFQKPSDPADDILVGDADAAWAFPVLKAALGTIETNGTFRTWAANAIGRGYIMHGLTIQRLDVPNTDAKTMAKNDVIHQKDSVGYQRQDIMFSYSNIVSHLVDLLWRSDLMVATFAEKTLQMISTNMTKQQQNDFLGFGLDQKLFDELRFKRFPCPPVAERPVRPYPSSHDLDNITRTEKPADEWAAALLRDLCSGATNDPVLGFLRPMISEIPSVASIILPWVVHLILVSETDVHHNMRDHLSSVFSAVLRNEGHQAELSRPLVLKTILYLRARYFTHETTMAQRNAWLDIDFSQAVIAAVESQMFHEALLFLEIHHSQAKLQVGRSSRRSFVSVATIPPVIENNIYENVDDPDFFYGKHEVSDLFSVLAKLTHEKSSQKSLSFQSALLDSHLKIEEAADMVETVSATAAALTSANMHGISEAVKQFYSSPIGSASLVRTGDPLSALTQWDVGPQVDGSGQKDRLGALLHVMQQTSSKAGCEVMLDQSLSNVVTQLISPSRSKAQTGQLLSQLAVLAEIKQVVNTNSHESLDSLWKTMIVRDRHVERAEFDTLAPLLVAREATFTTLRRNINLRASFGLSLEQSLAQEIRVVRQSLHTVSSHENSQFSLNRAMYLSELNSLATKVGLKADIAVQYDLATNLWSQGEISGSIGILQNLRTRDDGRSQAFVVSMAQILTDLGHKIADARLEKPDEIIRKYLQPACNELQGKNMGSEAGLVFHNFATFCDMQLQDTDNLDDFTRVSKIRDRKLREMNELKAMIESSEGKQREQLKGHLNKTKVWYNLDDKEFRRVSENRESLILQCLENFLLSMKACDDYPNDTLRFLALWLNQADSETANASVSKYLSSVPTLKFAPLVNQLSSRLLDTKDKFQLLLMDLMFRICSDHPYHSLYQVFSTSKTKAPKTDEVALSRNGAANKLADSIAKKSPSAAIWVAIHNSSIALFRVAQEKLSDKEGKSGSKLHFRKLPSGQKLEHMMTESHTKIPPPTMNIPLRADRDYSDLPTFSKFDQEVTIASGVSAPKIITMFATDGSPYKMLLKGGNDDLRQDAIMEQVFGQVSNLLKDHRPTRQRNLGIRTYKVIPLTTNAGIIEFVKDTIPLNDYLNPAHERYYPKDYKPNRARKEIADAQSKSSSQRVQAYKAVTTNFHPVMRFFFMENFLDPDEWFYKRLNYSRSTAAVSILGHVLGLGDRHGHNILLDRKSGEAVHIDLGVAFEAGRVLPVPEVVPFRLTRDLVDGMGLTGVEGVFRRCCNFTLEALRQDQEAIMTILDVLRYDPLYSWSISPLRLQRMQEQNEQAAEATAASMSTAAGGAAAATAAGAGGVVGAARRDLTEASEADRALTVVAKKLGKGLSVEATVNELIRQATDERNLAVLYCGWAAYA